jgi:hypothetical protein
MHFIRHNKKISQGYLSFIYRSFIFKVIYCCNKMSRHRETKRRIHHSNILVATVLVSIFLSPSASALSMKMNTAASTPGPLSSVVSFAADAGDNALSRVQWLGSRVAGKEGEFEQSRNRRSMIKSTSSFQVDGIGGSVINNQRRQLLEYQESFAVQNSELPDKYKNYINQNPVKERQVWEALANLEQDSKCSK